MTSLYDSEAWLAFSLGHPGGEEMTRSLLARSGLKEGDRVLDLCCGDGSSVRILESLQLEAKGADRETVIRRAQDQDRRMEEALSAWEGGKELPYEDQSFDAVLCECSLSLLDDRAGILREVRRVLKEQGLFLISDVTEEGPFDLEGFTLLDWQDESRHLKTFIARWLWETGTKFPRKGEDSSYFSGIYRKVD